MEVTAWGWGSVLWWAGTVGPGGGRGDHCPRSEGASPRGECIIPGMGEHRLEGGFVTPEMGDHSPGQGESLWGWGTNAPGTPSASLMLTDGHRRTFPAGLLPRGSAIGIRAAPIWQQLSRRWGRCCRKGHDPAAGQAPETGAELIIAGGSYFWGGGVCLTWVKGRRGGGRATPPNLARPWGCRGKGRCWLGMAMLRWGDTHCPHPCPGLARGTGPPLPWGFLCPHRLPPPCIPVRRWPQRGSCLPAFSFLKGSFWGGGAGVARAPPAVFLVLSL